MTLRFLRFALPVALALALGTGCGNTSANGDATAKRAPGGKDASKRGPGGGDVPVQVAKAVAREVPIDVEIIGNVEASSTVIVKPQVSGQLIGVFFKEGGFVQEGSRMFEIDHRSVDAQIQQAQAALNRSEAMLRQAEANLARDTAQADYAKVQADRMATLAKEGVAARGEEQQATAAAKAQFEALGADRAAIESAKADIASNTATIENLKVQLGFATIRAPISGHTGTLLVKQGNIVTANSSELVNINRIQPVLVAFSVPESQLGKVSSRFGKETIEVFATPQDRLDAKDRGVLTFVENSVDPATGTIKLRATFPNTQNHLWPGQFVRVRMRLGSIENAVVIPNQAVQTGQDGSFVYVVKDDRKVESRTITTSVRQGEDLVVASGLRAGETVVTEGQVRLAPGLTVAIRQPAGNSSGGGGTRAPGAKGGKAPAGRPDRKE